MDKSKPLTGRMVFAIFAGAFGVIITVNLALAWNAVATFPGLEVKNSYVASQSFDDRRAAQLALGWDVSAVADAKTVTLSIRDADGRPVQLGHLDATLGRATHVQADFIPDFAFNGRAYVANAQLAGGYWNLRMKAQALDGTAFEQRIEIYVKG